MALLAPSLLAADFARLGEALETIKAAGVCIVHVDVADGHFAPELTVGQPVIASLRKATDLVLEVHLLIERPERYVAQFVEAGADRVSFHVEATPHLHGVLRLIRQYGAKAGVALNPGTPVEALADTLGEVDFLTILAADSGSHEQLPGPWAVEKIRAASEVRGQRRLGFDIEVEGGITLDNVEMLVRAGADILVVGSAIFNNDSPRARLTEMIRMASVAGQISRV